MNDNHTVLIEKTTSNFSSIDDYEEAAGFYKTSDPFRPFNEGLKELLKRKGYKESLENNLEMADYLISKLRSINSTIEKETVRAWFSGKHRPEVKESSRRKMYEICFALNLTYEDVKWFFHHVYYDRSFNCHNINEAVFYFAFTHGTSYQEALDIITIIENTDTNENPVINNSTPNYTKFVQGKISNFTSAKELIDFLISSKENFKSWNGQAFNAIKELLDEIRGNECSKVEIEKLKHTLKSLIENKNNTISIKDYDNCGLLIKEMIYDANESANLRDLWQRINGKNIQSNSFILECLLTTEKGMSKIPADVPYIVKNNFPSKKVMSDVLDESKISTSRSYDSIRKMIVLLDFYAFWANIKIGTINIEKEKRFKTYRDEADCRLQECGYEPLFAGNPYDWIFLCSARNSDNPLEFFRFFLEELLPFQK